VHEASLKILVVLILTAVLRPALKFYAVQETLIILLTVGIGVVLLLAAIFALVLCWEGLRLASIWLTATVGQAAHGDTSTPGRGKFNLFLRR
jgi:endonuclease/exonuclease/phosphatase (EEP) superfamily protein YafD